MAPWHQLVPIPLTSLLLAEKISPMKQHPVLGQMLVLRGTGQRLHGCGHQLGAAARSVLWKSLIFFDIPPSQRGFCRSFSYLGQNRLWCPHFSLPLARTGLSLQPQRF